MKVLSAGFALLSLALIANAEPPVGNYLPPGQGFGAPSQNYGAPQKPSSQYGAPSGQYSAPSAQYSAPSSQYGAPSRSNNGHGSFSSRPSQSYGAPSQSYGAPSQSYGVPNGDQYDEPANYNFEYMVKDEHYGTDFGHKESRQGDRAEGEYYVLLPDGRKQIVRYEADEKGYRPMITYEDTNAGYGRGPANGGYSSGKPSGYSSGPSGPY